MAGDRWYQDTANFKTLSSFLAADEPGISGWWDAFCPLHEDNKRSAGINFDDNRWSCRAGCGSGTLDELVALMESGMSNGGDSKVVSIHSKRKKGKPPATEEEVQAWALNLSSDADGCLSNLESLRGISASTLQAHSIGWSTDHEAYTIPIWDADGDLINVRMYNPRRLKTKIWNWEGMNPSAIYPERVLKENDTVVICEGEWDALIANDRGFPAVTGTTGAMQWMPKWNRKFKGKDVIVVYDRDGTGDAASLKVAQNLEGIARSVMVAELPLEWSDKHGLDVSDFFHKEGRGPEEFSAVLRGARVHSAPKDGAPVKVSVKESYSPALSGTPQTMTVSVVGKGLQVHLIPKEVVLTCSINAGPKCHGCPMQDAEGNMIEEIETSSPVVLGLRDVTTAKRDDVLRDSLGIHKCGKMSVDVRSYMTTEMLVVRTSIDEDHEEDDHRSRAIVSVGEYRTGTNAIVRLTGTTRPSPQGQESVFQSWSLSPVESSLDKYELTPEDIELMMVFRPDEGQSTLKKMGHIARSMTNHVTKIYDRVALHIAMDLVFHSALSFRFADDVMERGWLELLVVGDARTGKSEVATKLSRHYRYGRTVSCEAASIPGLLGAVKPMPGGGNRGWTLEWGAIPLNDRRLVVLDEVNGLPVEHIGQLSSLRSSGIAEIVKAEREVTAARTRLIWLGNPRNNVHGMSSFMHGVEAISPLIGSQEDVARFDLAMSLSTDDVPSSKINIRRKLRRGNPYTSDACHALLSWIWSRNRDQVVWTSDAEDEVYRQALILGDTYVPDPPLIQMQNVRVKIARIAVAIAGRLFSATKDMGSILVNRNHVLAAVNFINHVYSSTSFGYLEVSRRLKNTAVDALGEVGYITDWLQGRPNLLRFLVSNGGRFRRQQLEEQANFSREETNATIHTLSSKGMIRVREDGSSYVPTKEFNEILRGFNK